MRAFLLVAALGLAVGCSSSGSATPVAAPTTSPFGFQPAGSPATYVSTTNFTTAAPPATVVAEFPKEVDIASIADDRIRNWANLSDRSVTTVVEVAPGVYANRGHAASLGTIDDFDGVFGLCADVKPFEQLHHAGGTCW